MCKSRQFCLRIRVSRVWGLYSFPEAVLVQGQLTRSEFALLTTATRVPPIRSFGVKEPPLEHCKSCSGLEKYAGVTTLKSAPFLEPLRALVLNELQRSPPQ
jgi:hypothetical protein